MPKQGLTVVEIILLACLFLVPGRAAAAANEQPNVVLVLVDDIGYGDIGAHGNPVLKTPVIDRLHHESVRLTDFHVSPMCTPTRGQIMTGLNPLRNGAMNVSSGRTMLRRELPTMADTFAAAGYATGSFGKWHLGDAYPYRPQDRGFQKAIWFPSSHIPSAPDYWKNDYFDTWLRDETGQTHQHRGYCTDIFFNEAIEWMKQQKAAGKPFFTYLPLNAAHGPLFVPDKYRQPYKDQKPAVASFFGMIANIDENMARLDAMLQAEQIADNTVLIFMTDNGGTAGVDVFNAGMRGKKISLYDGGHRVPCFVRFPKGRVGGTAAAGRDVGNLTAATDLLPTLIDLCRIKKLDGPPFEGVSLVKLLTGESAELPDRQLFVQFSSMNKPAPQKGEAAVMWNQWRLVSDKELYDIRADPGQQTNVIGDHPDVTATMRQAYDRWWNEISPRVNEFAPIVVGSPKANPTLLSPADWADSFLDQSAQIREGLQRNGDWNIEVAEPGEYEISLRRWPVESGLALTAEVPSWKGGDGTFTAGKALPIAAASITVGGSPGATSKMKVQDTDAAATFKVFLQGGRTTLRSSFEDAGGKELCGAYYVYVSRVGPER